MKFKAIVEEINRLESLRLKSIINNKEFTLLTELKQALQLLQPNVSGQSEPLKCQCEKSQFTRCCDADFNPMCGRCGRAL